MKNYNEVAKYVFDRRDEYNVCKLRRRRRVKNVVATVSCFCLVAIIGVDVWQGGLFQRSSVSPTVPSQDVSDNNPSAAIDSDNNASIFIPAVKLPENSSYASNDMIGLVVYNGKIYTQAEYINCDSDTYESMKQKYASEYLGTASGTIYEWSSQEEYREELASNITGDVYSVTGYDKNFRICMPKIYEEDGFIAFFENLNNITLSTGKDLYGDRLKLKNNYSDVFYQTHSDWDNEKEEYYQLEGVSAEDMSAFVDELYKSNFEDLSELSTDIYSQNLKQAHIYFEMNDGTTVGIRLFENGYVGYDNMYDRVFVKIDNDNFGMIFSAAVEG